MPKIAYSEIRMNPERRAMAELAGSILEEYDRAGYRLTLRGLYYKFVARDLFPASWIDPATGSTNNNKSYDKLQTLITDARMVGIIDWHLIEDKTREIDGKPTWSSPADFIESVAPQYNLDTWHNQPNRVEVWVEKDAQEDVVSKAARRLGIQYFSCRGYCSATSLWDAGQRLASFAESGQRPVILHLGDHDPSGLDMTRDIEERVRLFMGEEFGDDLTVERIALTREQVKKYKPPPNPAKQTDCRYEDYKAQHGEKCWELDALEPAVVDALIELHVESYRDDELYDEAEEENTVGRRRLKTAADNWSKLQTTLEKFEGKK